MDERIKPFANLRNADLHDADLHEVDLHGADLRNADLCNADMHDANLHDADLRGADLRGADLQGADLCNANLHGAADIVCAGYDARGFRFIGHGQVDGGFRISAGCRWFTEEEARAHWKAKNNLDAQLRIAVISNFFETKGK